MGRYPIIPGEHEIFGLAPDNAILRLRILGSEICCQIVNGSTKAISSAYLSKADARALASDLLTERGSPGRVDLRLGRGLHLVGIVLRIGTEDAVDYVIADPTSKRIGRLSNLLMMLSYDLEE